MIATTITICINSNNRSRIDDDNDNDNNNNNKTIAFTAIICSLYVVDAFESGTVNAYSFLN